MSNLVEPLLPLQDLDHRIHELKTRKGDKPRELAEFQGKVDKAKSNLDNLKTEIHDLRKGGSARELEVKEFEEKISKLTVQSNLAKKNDEYHSILKEISGIKADKGRIEDSLLDIYMQVDEKAKLEKIRQEEVQAAEKEFAVAKARIDDEIGVLNQEIEKLLDDRRGISEGIQKDVLVDYDRILEVKDDGQALSRVIVETLVDESGKTIQYSCDGCNVKVNAQDFNRVLLGRELVRCRHCSRILYHPSEEPA